MIRINLGADACFDQEYLSREAISSLTVTIDRGAKDALLSIDQVMERRKRERLVEGNESK